MKGFKQGAQVGKGVMEHGEVMGFARGGQVKKDVSGDFVMKTKKMDSMDDGNMPKTEGDSEQEKEAGGRAKVRPGYKEGGQVKGYRRCMKGGKMHYMKGGVAHVMKGGKMCPMAR